MRLYAGSSLRKHSTIYSGLRREWLDHSVVFIILRKHSTIYSGLRHEIRQGMFAAYFSESIPRYTVDWQLRCPARRLGMSCASAVPSLACCRSKTYVPRHTVDDDQRSSARRLSNERTSSLAAFALVALQPSAACFSARSCASLLARDSRHRAQ